MTIELLFLAFAFARRPFLLSKTPRVRRRRALIFEYDCDIKVVKERGESCKTVKSAQSMGVNRLLPAVPKKDAISSSVRNMTILWLVLQAENSSIAVHVRRDRRPNGLKNKKRNNVIIMNFAWPSLTRRSFLIPKVHFWGGLCGLTDVKISSLTRYSILMVIFLVQIRIFYKRTICKYKFFDIKNPACSTEVF